MALINLLVNLSKLPYVDKLFVGRKWLRVILALVLGASGGLVMALIDQKPLMDVLMSMGTGVVAGVGASGLHELTQAAKTWIGLK
jgi:hypothetical protein